MAYQTEESNEWRRIEPQSKWRKEQVQRAIIELKSRNLFDGDDECANFYYDRLLHPETLKGYCGKFTLEEYYTMAQDRAISLLSQRDTVFDRIPIDVHTFSHEEFPGYPRNLLIDNEACLVQRSQLSGLCYMHACAVVQCYAIWHSVLAGNTAASSGGEMLDLRWFLLTKFTSTELRRHVFEDEGGSSENFLKRILDLDREDTSTVVLERDMSKFSEKLTKYGPALVAGFEVDRDFYDNLGKHVHTGTRWRDPVGHHSMVLLGARLDAKGVWHFLLQNWWKRKQFVEVDSVYMKSCNAYVYFIKKPQVKIPEAFERNNCKYAETIG